MIKEKAEEYLVNIENASIQIANIMIGPAFEAVLKIQDAQGNALCVSNGCTTVVKHGEIQNLQKRMSLMILQKKKD